MKYLLDTCVISDFVKGDKNTLAMLKHVSPHDIAISSITVMEIHYGLALNPRRSKTIEPIMRSLVGSITILEFDSNDAMETATIRALLKQQGQPIGSYDILLAGTALNHNLVFVTSNTNEFNRVDGLVLANWRELTR